MVLKGKNLIPSEENKNSDLTEVNSRFRTLGCMPCTGAVKSNATNIDTVSYTHLTLPTNREV